MKGWPTSQYGGPHVYADVPLRHDPYVAAIGRAPSSVECVLTEAMVDIRLWAFNTKVWIVHGRNETMVSGPFTIRSHVIETDTTSGTGMVAYVQLWEKRGRVRAHCCYPTRADADARANRKRNE